MKKVPNPDKKRSKLPSGHFSITKIGLMWLVLFLT